MSKYYVRFHTGAGDREADTLDEAKRMGDDGACYTQADISIEDADGNVILCRRWFGLPLSEDDGCDDPIQFGDFGFYADWTSWQ